jgi:SSS family solute:Na+ symporter
MIALALFPGIRGDEAYPTLVISHLLPAGVRGIVIASLLAALMSSLASTFNSSSTLITMDFYKHFRPDANGRELVLVGRLATTVLVIFGILWVPLIRSISNQIFIYLQSVQSYISPPIAAVFIWGLLLKWINGKAAIVSLVSGGILGALRLILEILSKREMMNLGMMQWYADMNYLHFAIFLFGISSAVLMFVSLLSAKPEKHKLAGYTITKIEDLKDAIKGTGGRSPVWDKLNIAFSIVLLLLIFSLWGIFF